MQQNFCKIFCKVLKNCNHFLRDGNKVLDSFVDDFSIGRNGSKYKGCEVFFVFHKQDLDSAGTMDTDKKIATLVLVTRVSCSENEIVISGSGSERAPKKSMLASSGKSAAVVSDTPCELYMFGVADLHLLEKDFVALSFAEALEECHT